MTLADLSEPEHLKSKQVLIIPFLSAFYQVHVTFFIVSPCVLFDSVIFT